MPQSDRTPTLPIEKYRPIGTLGAGGMGRVFSGCAEFPVQQKRPCAIKVIREDVVDVRTVALFAREAMIGWDVSGHSNIVTTRSFGKWSNGRLFLVTDREGPALDEVFEELQEDWQLIRTIARHILCALLHLRRKGIVHCDVSLANILLSTDGYAKLNDFGLARHERKSSKPGRKSPGDGMIGVPGYASPEVLRGARATHASDLYSLGVVLYELVTGTMPYGSGAAGATIHRQDNVPVEPLPGSIPADLKRLINGLMMKRPQDRPTHEEALTIIGQDGQYMRSDDNIAALATRWIKDSEAEGDRPPRVATKVDLLHAADRYLREREALRSRLAREDESADSAEPAGDQHDQQPERKRSTTTAWCWLAAAAVLIALAVAAYDLGHKPPRSPHTAVKPATSEAAPPEQTAAGDHGPTVGNGGDEAEDPAKVHASPIASEPRTKTANIRSSTRDRRPRRVSAHPPAKTENPPERVRHRFSLAR